MICITVNFCAPIVSRERRMLKGYSLSRGEISVDTRLNVN